jgi:Tfp pilus assembly protein PilF
MKKFATLLAIGFFTTACFAQPTDPKQLHETAQAFMRQNDYANATLVLNRALLQEPKNTAMNKDLAQCYYYQNEPDKALATIKLALERDDADDQCYQIAANIYKVLDNTEECEKIYRKGIKKFPSSGPLYNEYGELLFNKQDANAIKQWEKGIEMDPSFSKNYYNACRYYFAGTDKIWSILYGEIFVNMEPMNPRTPEVKNLLLEGYKKLFADANLTKYVNPNPKIKNGFTEAFLQTMNKQTNVAANGINAETLTMIRTRFILDWYNDFGTKFPFRPFELQRQLLQDGMFDAYNQWIFGAAQNLPAYQNWTSTHSAEYGEFTRFQKGRMFKIPAGQYYYH